MTIHADHCAVRKHDLNHPFGPRRLQQWHAPLKLRHRRGRLGRWRCFGDDIDACEPPHRVRRLPSHTPSQLLSPGIQLSGAEPMLANDFARPDARLQALRDDLPLLLGRPAPAPLAARDYLNPLRAGGHMTALMTAPYRTVLLD